jgi:hypothetical protein
MALSAIIQLTEVLNTIKLTFFLLFNPQLNPFQNKLILIIVEQILSILILTLSQATMR